MLTAGSFLSKSCGPAAKRSRLPASSCRKRLLLKLQEPLREMVP